MTTYIHDVIATSFETIKIEGSNGKTFFNNRIQVKWKKGKEVIAQDINLLSDKRVSIEEII
jgi:phosphotransferase system IIA component|tara:strand:+ start:97 stop:279 length:183 start_codon:yes stop_codon:yes gene_type:complete